MNKILPCPYPTCGNENLDVAIGKDGFSVDCVVCNAAGPTCDTEESAITAWNVVARKTCEWKPVYQMNEDWWKTDCGSFAPDGIYEGEFCPYCGKYKVLESGEWNT